MARDQIEEWRVFYPHGAKKYGTRIKQDGRAEFTKKKKNGNRLASLAEIRRQGNVKQQKMKHVSCALAFKKISIVTG
jgi:hypothetical protein